MRASSPYTVHWMGGLAEGEGFLGLFEPQGCATPKPITLIGASSPPFLI